MERQEGSGLTSVWDELVEAIAIAYDLSVSIQGSTKLPQCIRIVNGICIYNF